MQYISDLDNAILQAHAQERKNLAIMGSTGTIGKNALAIIRNAPELFSITALAGGKNITLLAKQALEFTPPYLAVQEEKYVELLYKALKKSANSSYKPEILYGKIGYAQLASLQEVDIVLSAQVGAAGLRATICAAQHGKTICLANKESLVLAGDYIRQLVQQTKATILPVDSEHYAIFQCLFQNYTSSYINSASPQTFVTKTFAPEIFGNSTQTHSPQNTFLEQNACQKNSRVKRLILTASGGPFRTKSMEFLKSVKKEDALKHPNWSMGAKITIDSATLMNKGLEVIEACHLYGLSMEQIDVLVHPQSIVHSLVEWQDGSMLAQLAVPDMRLPIAACL